MVSYLLRNGADIDAKNQDMDTPLDLATRAQRVEIVNLLFKNGGLSKNEIGSDLEADISNDYEFS